MEGLAIGLALATAAIYIVLGPFIIPKLLKKGEDFTVLVARWGLATFFLACAGTHTYLAYLVGKTADPLSHSLLVHGPQVVGGVVFLIMAFLYDREHPEKETVKDIIEKFESL